MDEALYGRALSARARVEQGTLRGAELAALIAAVPRVDRDVWVDALLGIEEAPAELSPLPRGCVPYLPCGVDEILATVQEAPVGRGDDVVDLGSGLGRVAILVHLLTGARTSGIEIQPQLVDDARARCSALGLSGVSFVCANAVEADLDGSVFFLYAPFNGAMLRAVIQRLEALARKAPFVVCAVGLEFHDVPWLRPRKSPTLDLTIYDALGGG